MSKIEYVPHRFSEASLEIIDLAETICHAYAAQGLDLTLRQLYYQFISRDFFPNSERSYNRLGSIINDARLAGLIDWNHLQDRGRAAHGTGWMGTEPPEFADVIRRAKYSYSVDLWEGQPRRVEVWVEKQALEQVVERATSGLRLPYFACKGYVSQSEMWAAGMRMADYFAEGYEPLVIHLGDHDPSGIDMTRDIEDRLTMFCDGQPVEVRRIALNMDQVERYNPPPNPAKLTDSRAGGYVAKYGRSSWELDALNPEQLMQLIRAEVDAEIDVVRWNEQVEREREGRDAFEAVATRWPELQQYLTDNPIEGE